MTFSDKVAIVASDSTGIGLATALHLAQRGARAAIRSHDAATLESARTRISAHGEAIAVEADVAGGRHGGAGREAVGAFGGVDYLVNSAGIQTYGTVSAPPKRPGIARWRST